MSNHTCFENRYKNLENYGVQELNAREIQETDGGFLEWIAVAVSVGGIVVWAFEKGEELGKELAK